MSYTVLARKWRPRRFGEMVGQQHVVKALVNSLAAERLHHAYLFAGTRGVGKTTLARILAKALNCVEGIVAEPCGDCGACTAIDDGRFVDLIEVDAASRTRVDDTRELMENTQYTPAQGRFKVYLIDEVHMLSNHSFNALLKTLEEPPPHIKFLLATTDPQKLPVTVLSRCLQFNLKRLTVAEIGEQMDKIREAEEFEAEADGLKALARAADGSMRDGLSLLDQAIAFSAGDVTAEAVSAMLGSIDRKHVIRFVQALAALDGSALMNEVAELDEMAPDYGAVLDELRGVLQRIAVLQLVESDTDEEARELPELASALSPEDVQLYYEIAGQGLRDLYVSRDYRASFEMTLLRMLAFRPVTEQEPRSQEKPRSARVGANKGAAADARTATGPRQPAVTQTTAGPSHPTAAGANAPPRQPAAARGGPPGKPRAGPSGRTRSDPSGTPHAGPSDKAPGGLSGMPRAGPSRTPTAGSEPSSTSAARGNPSRPTTEQTTARQAKTEVTVPGPDTWAEFIGKTGVNGAPRQLAEHCAVKRSTSDGLVLVLASGAAHLNTERVRKRLLDQLRKLFSGRVSVRIEVGEPPGPTPAQIRAEGQSERMRRARESVEGDPLVKDMQTRFDAVLELESIQPLESKET